MLGDGDELEIEMCIEFSCGSRFACGVSTGRCVGILPAGWRRAAGNGNPNGTPWLRAAGRRTPRLRLPFASPRERPRARALVFYAFTRMQNYGKNFTFQPYKHTHTAQVT